MNKRTANLHEVIHTSETDAGHAKRRPLHVMGFGDSKGHSLELYLCCFCSRLPDLSLSKHCRDYHLASGTECPHFSRVPDIAQRINQLIAAKEKQEHTDHQRCASE